MRKYTKGPWLIRAERYRFIHVYSLSGGIAHLDTIDREGAANARLIAAAPVMREALEEIAEKCSRFDGCPVSPKTIADIAISAITKSLAAGEDIPVAIAKAKGEQQ